MASILTLVAMPFLISESRRVPDSRASAVATAPAGGDLSASLRSAPSSSEKSQAATTIDVGYLAGPSSSQTTEPPVIAVPAPLPDKSATGRAGYFAWPAGSTFVSNPCSSHDLRVGTKITITNLDNGHVTHCVVAINTNDLPKSQILIINSTQFTDLADLIDSPIPVRLTW